MPILTRLRQASTACFAASLFGFLLPFLWAIAWLASWGSSTASGLGSPEMRPCVWLEAGLFACVLGWPLWFLPLTLGFLLRLEAQEEEEATHRRDGLVREPVDLSEF